MILKNPYKVGTMIYAKERKALGQIIDEAYTFKSNGYDYVTYKVYWFKTGFITHEYEASVIKGKRDYRELHK